MEYLWVSASGEEMNAAIDAISGKPETVIAGQIIARDKRIAELEGSIDEIRSAVALDGRNRDRLIKDAEAAAAEIASLKAGLEEAIAGLHETEPKLQAALATMEEALGERDTARKLAEERLGRLEIAAQQREEAQQAILALRAEIGKMGERIVAAERSNGGKKRKALEARIAALEADIEDARKINGRVRSDLRHMTAERDRLQAIVEGADGGAYENERTKRLRELEADNQRLEGNMRNMTAGFDALLAQYNGASAVIDERNRRVDYLGGEVNRLHGLLDAASKRAIGLGDAIDFEAMRRAGVDVTAGQRDMLGADAHIDGLAETFTELAKAGDPDPDPNGGVAARLAADLLLEREKLAAAEKQRDDAMAGMSNNANVALSLGARLERSEEGRQHAIAALKSAVALIP